MLSYGGEAMKHHQEGRLREPILISDNGTAHNGQGDVLNLAFMFAVPQGIRVMHATICATRSRIERRRRSSQSAWFLGATWRKFPIASGPNGVLCEFYKRDHKSDYKALPVDPRETRFAVITSKCPKGGKYYAFVRRTLLFGSISSVRHYNVFARIVTELQHPSLIREALETFQKLRDLLLAQLERGKQKFPNL